MIIAGLDLSPKSPGCFKYTLDKDMNPIDFDYIGFTDVKKNEQEKIHFYHKSKTFNHYIEREDWMLEKIMKFCEDVEYISIEDYAFAASGRVFHIAEFTGLIKYNLFKAGKSVRLYDPASIKIFATTRGNCDKISMAQAYVKETLLGFDYDSLPKVKKSSGNSPTSDLIDAYYACNLLRTEMTLREGLTSVKDYSKDIIRIFNRVTTSNPTNILDTEFISIDNKFND